MLNRCLRSFSAKSRGDKDIDGKGLADCLLKLSEDIADTGSRFEAAEELFGLILETFARDLPADDPVLLRFYGHSGIVNALVQLFRVIFIPYRSQLQVCGSVRSLLESRAAADPEPVMSIALQLSPLVRYLPILSRSSQN